jgi:CBS domain-containing protein
MITSVILPLLNASATIRDAVQRLAKSGRSAVVIRDERGPVVVTDRSLLNTLVSEGEQALSRVADRAFPGILGAHTVLADAQRKYIVTEVQDATVQDATARVEADADAAEELARPSRVEFPAERKIKPVALPLLNPEATIRDAVGRLTASGRSAVVIRHRRGPVVATDRSLLDALKADPHQTLSRFADQAFPGILGARTELARAQRQYTVRELQDGMARVDVDADVAQELARPSTLFP